MVQKYQKLLHALNIPDNPYSMIYKPGDPSPSPQRHRASPLAFREDIFHKE
jgi:hypothetical protein